MKLQKITIAELIRRDGREPGGVKPKHGEWSVRWRSPAQLRRDRERNELLLGVFKAYYKPLKFENVLFRNSPVMKQVKKARPRRSRTT